MNREWLKQHPAEFARGLFVWLLIGVFSVAYIRLGYLNEIHLRNGIDLGTYTQILWNVNHGHFPPYNTIKDQVAWGDHAHFALVLLAPIFALFPSPITVLVLQALAITTSAWAIYAIAQKKLQSTFFSFVITLAYLGFFGVQYALDVDFHANVLTAAVFAWSLYAFTFERWWLYWPLLALGLTTREDAAPFYVMFGIYLLLAYRWRYWRVALVTLGISLTYFFAIGYFVMPRWNPGGTPLAYFDAPVGSHNPLAIAWWIVRQPITIAQNITGTAEARHTLQSLLQAFGYTSLFTPFTYLVAAPNVLANFLSGEEQRHLMKFHYSVSLAPVLAYGSIIGVAYIAKFAERLRAKLSHVVVGFGALAVLVGAYTSSWEDIDLPIRQLTIPGYFLSRYHGDVDYDMVRALLNLIPENDSVATVGSLVPAFASRSRIFIYSDQQLDRFQWIILTTNHNSWPMSRGEVLNAIRALRANSQFERFLDYGGIFVFHRAILASR